MPPHGRGEQPVLNRINRLKQKASEDQPFQEILEDVASRCRNCGLCLRNCDIGEEVLLPAPGDIARKIMDNTIDNDIRHYADKCALCGLCTHVCPEGIDKSGLIVGARDLLLEKGATDPETYRIMWVDHDWNAITLYRDTYQLDFSTLIRERSDTLFVPSCSLSNRSPELVGKVVEWLAANDMGEVGLFLACCGAPLMEMGLLERAGSYRDAFWRRVEQQGARTLVTACPACQSYLETQAAGKDIRVVTIYELLAARRVRVPVLDGGRITVHDSCPARFAATGDQVRSLLADYEVTEMSHHGRRTLCCGAGGAIAMSDPALCEKRARRRLKEFHDTKTDVCVTYCMACSDTFEQYNEQGAVRHVLELLFGAYVNHAEYAAKVAAMWEGEWGRYNAYRLANSRPLDANLSPVSSELSGNNE